MAHFASTFRRRNLPEISGAQNWTMTRDKPHHPHTASNTAELSCDECGQLPEASKSRLTVVSVLTILPIELLAHAIVVNTHLPYLLKVLTLAVTATALVIWVAEPSAKVLLRRWLHAPALRRRRKLHASPALWRVRTVLPDQAGSLERVTHGLSRLDVNILSIHVHPVTDGVLDEFVLSAPGELGEDELLAAVSSHGGRRTRVWPTTPVVLTDGQTQALSLAARVAADPAELPHAIAELLSAEHLDGARLGRDGHGTVVAERLAGGDPTLLKIPTTWHEPLLFDRPDEPFTPAESGRAHRLAELAEVVEVTASLGSRASPRDL